MNKLLLDASLDYYPQYNTNKVEGNNSTATYTDTSFHPAQLTYALPNSPDSCVSTKTPHSPSAAMCNIAMPSLIAPSSSLSLPNNTPAVSITLSTSDYYTNDHIESNETASSFYSSFFGNGDKQPHEHVSLHNSTHQQDKQKQTHSYHPLQSNQNPGKKQRRQTTTVTRSTLKPPTNSPSVTVPFYPSTSPTLTTPSMTHQQASRQECSAKETVNAKSDNGGKSVTRVSPRPINFDLGLQQETPLLENEERKHTSSPTDIRRQIHIQSEQKRRAQIKCGFEELRNELPVCLNKKMSKVALLHRTVQHIQHLKSTQITILTELERLVQENEQLKRFQQSVLQKQVMDSIYPLQ